jgi:transposase
MLRITLRADEQAKIEQTFKTTADRRVRDRCQAVLMANRGRKRKTIAAALGVQRTPVKKGLAQYQARGLAGLQRGHAPGQPRRSPKMFAATIVEWVKARPQGCGLKRANWTYEELAVQVYRTTGSALNRTAMREFCQRQQIRPSRPTSPYLRGGPHRQAVATEELAELKKSPRRGVPLVKPRRSAVAAGAHSASYARGQRPASREGHVGQQRLSLEFRGDDLS